MTRHQRWASQAITVRQMHTNEVPVVKVWGIRAQVGVLLWLFLLVLVPILRGPLLGFAGFTGPSPFWGKCRPLSLFFHFSFCFVFSKRVFVYGFSGRCNRMNSCQLVGTQTSKRRKAPPHSFMFYFIFVSPTLSTTLVLPLALFFFFFCLLPNKW